MKPPVRYTPVTRNGRTHHVPTNAPRPPRDWDHTVLTAVTIATTTLVCVSVAWSTASIGALLATTITAALAYGAASAFDLVWIISMAVEWLARYDSTRARLPRWAGHISLAIAMTAVGIHGYLSGNWATAGIGAFVSALAKGGWTVVMRHQAVTLDPHTAAWLRAERASRGAARALAAEERVDARAAGQLAAIRDSIPPASRDTDVLEKVADAVQDAPDTMPGADPEAITDYLSRRGIHLVQDTPGQAGQDTDIAGHGIVRGIRPDKATAIADTVRACLRDGVRDRDMVVDTVRATHGAHVPRNTVIKTLRRLDPTA